MVAERRYGSSSDKNNCRYPSRAQPTATSVAILDNNLLCAKPDHGPRLPAL